MKFSHLLLCAAGMPLLAGAQADRAMPAAADPNASVAPLRYRSVLVDYVAAKEPAKTPDQGWLAANRAVMDTDGELATATAAPALALSGKPSDPQPTPAKHEHGGAQR